MSNPNAAGPPPAHHLTRGTCHRLLTNTLDRRSLPRVQIIKMTEQTQPSGISRHPPLWTLWISDSLLTIPVVAGLDVVHKIQSGHLQCYDEVRLIGHEVWFPPLDNQHCVSILVWNVARVQAHPEKIGRPAQRTDIVFARANAYTSVRGDPKSYEWVPPAYRQLVSQGPPLLRGLDANIPVDGHNNHAPQNAQPALQGAPMGGWLFTVGEPLPNFARHMIPPGWTPLDANGLVQEGLNSVCDVPGWGYRWGANPTEILARQGAHPVNPAIAQQPAPAPNPYIELLKPFAYPTAFVPLPENHPAHPGWDLLSSLGPGNIGNAVVRVTRIENKNSTIDLVVHDPYTTMDAVVRPELKPYVDRLRIGRCYQLFNVKVVATAKWCRTFHKAQLALDKSCKIYEQEDPQIPDYIIRPRRLNQLERGFYNKSIDVWCVIMNTSAIIPGKPKQDATKGWTTPPSLTRCECWVTDKTLIARRLMAWDEFPEQLYGRDGEVVMLHNVLMDDTRQDDICLKTQHGLTEIWLGQDHPMLAAAYNDMVAWWNMMLANDTEWNVLALSCSAEGSKALRRWGLTTRAPTLSMAQVEAQHLGLDQVPSHFKIEGHIQVLNPGSVTYVGCANPHCNKKVEAGNAISPTQYQCARCDHVFEKGMGRYRMRFRIKDRNGDVHEAVAFDTATKGALGMSAEYMRQRMDLNNNDFEQYNLARWAVDNLETKRWLMTVEARTEQHGPWKGRNQWIVTEFVKKS
ncbi:hypothetical protein CALCODRAFT_483333 [Calocera cornea HHB12733]|uniref:Replication factor A C-terminal domain-containing protein n=1 Tax=Calocera cornea HHB12733 TaxID=1353952 RepID=A0A165FVQ7_9BASI|nr:hypothetical protein CALCODRAFT_483333 [Calocera cornea HHB12733]